MIQTIHTNYTTSISELKKSPTAVLDMANGEAIAILNHNKPSAYLVPSDLYEKLIEIAQDALLAKEVKSVLQSGEKPIKVSLSDL